MSGQVIAPGPQRDSGLFILAVNPSLFGTGEEFPARVAEYAQSIRDTRPLDPEQPVRVPFDRSIAERNRRLALDAIDVPDSVVQNLRGIIDRGQASSAISMRFRSGSRT